MKNRISGVILTLIFLSFVFNVSAQFSEQGSSTDNWVSTGRLQVGSTSAVSSTLRFYIKGGSAHHGLYAESNRASGYGIYGRNDAAGAKGIQGLSSNGIGVRGWSASGTGLLAESNTGLAGEFRGPVKMFDPSGSHERFSFDANGALTASGNDPDLTLNIPGSAGGNLLQLRFQVDGSTMAEFQYDKNLDLIALVHDGAEVARFNKNGGNYWMEVEHGIRTGRVQTDATLADYVFTDDYNYPTLTEVDSFINEHHHLPGVVSQAEVDAQGGVDLTDFTIQLQEKLEELYLHVIEMDKRVAELEAENAALKEEIEGDNDIPSNQ